MSIKVDMKGTKPWPKSLAFKVYSFPLQKYLICLSMCGCSGLQKWVLRHLCKIRQTLLKTEEDGTDF